MYARTRPARSVSPGRYPRLVSRVAVRLLHVEADPAAGTLVRRLVRVRRSLADQLADQFRLAGADDVRVVAAPPDDTPFGARLRAIVRDERPAGLVVAGSGSLVLARARDLRPFVDAAARSDRFALANNRFSADCVAVACSDVLLDLPDLPGDNALPRWLAEVAGYVVRDRRSTAPLQVDVDGPLDVLLVGEPWPDADEARPVLQRLDRVRAVARDQRGEILIAGRTSAAALRVLETGIAARVRAVVEERGLRAAAAAARSDRSANRRPPRSVLGLLLDSDGPGALGEIVARVADAAIIDSRVLLAHRLGADERAWPPPEDRFASDLLLPERVEDAWLRELTESAVHAAIPVLLGGHTVVGPGLSRAVGARGHRR
jgi:hypothetical protein